ncbi:MAG: hypothetical protein ACR2RB_17975 [Gammaproteobacteria bacterium]
MTPQSTFMIIAPIVAERVADLRELLAGMNLRPGMADPHNSLVPFYQFSQLHFARFVILEANSNDDIRRHGVDPAFWPPTLAFVGDIDGPGKLFLAELTVRAEAGLRRIFSHCEGFDAERTKLLAWMHEHNTKPSANYVNWRGRTVVQVREEKALSDALREQVANVLSEPGVSDPQAVRRRLKAFVDSELATLRLRLTPEQPTPPAWAVRNFIHLVGVPAVLLALAPLLLIGAPFYVMRLRALEKSDPENLLRPARDHARLLATQEDHYVSNQFNVFGQVKPGRFRNYTIRFLLWLVDYSARHIYNRGYLTRIQTIVFARWVLLDNNKRVYFASNYDGSLDSYMDDFINKVAWGLNLVFSNGVGYPRTRWLLKGGAQYEGKYKRTLRRNQLPSESWYKSYPGLSAVELARNARIRKGLEARNPSDREVRDWLSLL